MLTTGNGLTILLVVTIPRSTGTCIHDVSESARVAGQETRAKATSAKASEKAPATVEAAPAAEKAGRKKQPLEKQPMPSDFMYPLLAAYCLVVRSLWPALATRC